MSILSLRVYAECDRCGEAFSVGIDAAKTLCNDEGLSKWAAVHDLALVAVVESLDYKTKEGDYLGISGWSTVMTGAILCATCTTATDADEIEKP